MSRLRFSDRAKETRTMRTHVFLGYVVLGTVLATVCGAVAVAGQGQGGRGRGGQGGPPQPAGPVSPASMTSRFEGGCAICHDNPAAQATGASRAPTREALRALTPERVYAALTTGSMQVQAQNMTEEQKRAIAELVTGKQFGGTANRSVSAMSNACAAPLRLDNPMAKPRWNGWNPDQTTSYRFVPPETGKITGDQIPRLKLKWAVAFPDAASPAQSQP